MMMSFLLPIAAKSLLIAGAVLLLLKLAEKRSASDRSWIAHLGLAAVLLLPLAVALPSLDVQGPGFLAARTQPQVATAAAVATTVSPGVAVPAVGGATATGLPPSTASASSASIDWPLWAYGAPAAALLLLTLIALGRLFVLKARAHVLVEPHWLTALALAQRRMGFKHGTALLTSDELPSPISWGVVRPVILLNREAAESRVEAEAIIAHELAHVASLDWAKLLLSRIAVALFWFNPLVWLLAREAHQLREEAADDAVLGANIPDTDYAQLLVGVARHECRGLLLGAHGVAPARNSLTRRVRRVLDGALARAPGGWRWSAAAAFFAAGMAVPLAALNFVNSTAAHAASEGRYAGPASPDAVTPTDSLAGEVRGRVAAAAATTAVSALTEVRSNGSSIVSDHGKTVLRGADGSRITLFAADPTGRRRVEVRSADGRIVAYSDARAIPGGLARIAFADRPGRDNPIDRSIDAKAVGVTPEYAAAIRAASPRLRDLDMDDIVEMKAVGVTPAFVRDLATAGFEPLDADSLTQARAVGVTGDYIRGMAAAGYRGSLDDYVEMRAVGVTPDYAARWRRHGFNDLTADKLVELKAQGIEPGDVPPQPPTPPE